MQVSTRYLAAAAAAHIQKLRSRRRAFLGLDPLLLSVLLPVAHGADIALLPSIYGTPPPNNPLRSRTRVLYPAKRTTPHSRGPCLLGCCPLALVPPRPHFDAQDLLLSNCPSRARTTTGTHRSLRSTAHPVAEDVRDGMLNSRFADQNELHAIASLRGTKKSSPQYLEGGCRCRPRR